MTASVSTRNPNKGADYLKSPQSCLKFVLAGDFNARTGKENDFITDESGKFIPGGDIPPPPNLTK